MLRGRTGSEGQRSRSGKTISCAECRRLKVKCDLKFPCAHCIKRGLENICPTGELSDGIRGQRVLAGTEELHRRITALEDALRQASSSTHPLLNCTSRSMSISSDTGGGTDGPNVVIGSASVKNGLVTGDGAEDSLAGYSHLVVEEDPGRSKYYGAASSVYLTKRSTMNRQSHSVTGLIPPRLFDLPTPNAGQASASIGGAPMTIGEIIISYLPSEEVARELSDLYYRSFGWFTNIVPLSGFDAKYIDPVYHSSTLPPSQNLAVLFLVLALGAVMHSDQSTADELIYEYISGARQSLALDMSHSVTLAQICYLYVTFVMNGRKDTAGGEIGWPFLRAGMAIVEAIGLHRDPAQWDLPPEDATERRIVFWEIHGYDVLQSIALGRGQCIADYSIDCDLPDDGDETSFHRMAYTLTRIWSRINERQIRISPSPYTDVIDIDEALNKYEKALPPHLSSGVAPSLYDLTDPLRRRLAFRRNMILMYLTEARMALHRGWFVRSLKEYPIEPLKSPQSRSFVNCLEACRTLIGLVRSMLALHDQQINRRWHFFFHLFSACACLAACAIRAPRSELAPAVMAELDSGIALFQIAGRDETAQLQRLANIGREAIRLGGRGQEDDSEDLDLLSARKTFRRSDLSEGRHRNRISPESTELSGEHSLKNTFLPGGFGPSTAHEPTGPSSSFANDGHLPNIHRFESGFDHTNRGQPVPMPMPVAEMVNDPMWNHVGQNGPTNLEADIGNLGDFDVNAFLEEMGLLV